MKSLEQIGAEQMAVWEYQRLNPGCHEVEARAFARLHWHKYAANVERISASGLGRLFSRVAEQPAPIRRTGRAVLRMPQAESAA